MKAVRYNSAQFPRPRERPLTARFIKTPDAAYPNLVFVRSLTGRLSGPAPFDGRRVFVGHCEYGNNSYGNNI